MDELRLGRPPKDLDPLRAALSALPRRGAGMVLAPVTRLATQLGWHRHTVTAALERLATLGEVRLKRGSGKRGIFVVFIEDGKPVRVPVWHQRIGARR